MKRKREEEQDDWNLEWYKTDSGAAPLQGFLEGLTGRNREEGIALIEMLQKWGNRLRAPRSKALGNGLFELRGHEVRIFYMFLPGRRVVLLDGIIKKRGDIPARVLREVRSYQQEINAMEEKKAKRGT